MTTPRVWDLKLERLSEDDPRVKSWRAGRVNWDFYVEHAEALWKKHDGKELLIYDGGTVEAFDDIDQLIARRDELDDETRMAALHRWQMPERMAL